MPTPSSGTRPGSQTNSYSGQLSVASGMSVVDDRKLDEILGDGLQNQVSLSKIKVKILKMDLLLRGKKQAKNAFFACSFFCLF